MRRDDTGLAPKRVFIGCFAIVAAFAEYAALLKSQVFVTINVLLN